MAVTYMIQNLASQHTKYYVKKKNETKKFVLPGFRPEGWCLPQLYFDGTENNQIKTINDYLLSISPAQVTPEKKKPVRSCDGFFW